MLREVKEYYENNQLKSIYYLDDDNNFQGFYKSFFENGDIRTSLFSVNSIVIGTWRSCSFHHQLRTINTGYYKCSRHGVCIYFNYLNSIC